MLKNITRRGVWLGAAALILMSASPAMATHDATAEADATAVDGTGIFEGLLDTDTCKHVDTKTTAKGKEVSGPCGKNLNSNEIDAFTQVASASGSSTAPGNQTDQNNDPVVANKGLQPGTSAAVADVAGPIDLTDPAFALDLSDLALSLSENTINNIVGGLGGTVGDLLQQLNLLAPVVDTLDSVLNPLLDAVSGALPLAVHVRGVVAQCSATPGKVTGNGTVAGVDLDIDLGGQLITVPLQLETEPNSPLLVTAPQDLVDGILYGATPEDPSDGGLQETLFASLGGALNGLNALLVPVAQDLLDPLLEALEPTLLEQLNGLLEPLITGTVNKQETTGGHLEVTALEVILLGTNELDTAKVGCGPNTAGTPHNGTPTPTPTNDDGDDGDGDDSDDGDGDDGDGDDDEPKSVDSGLNDGGNLGALAITGLLAASTLVGSAARQRLLLDQ